MELFIHIVYALCVCMSAFLPLRGDFVKRAKLARNQRRQRGETEWIFWGLGRKQINAIFQF